MDEAAPCTHTWEKIGTATANGDTWMQEFYVYACSTCGKIGTANTPHKFFDYRRRRPEEVARLRADEQAALEKLTTDYRNDPEGVKAAFVEQHAREKARIEQLRAEARQTG